MCGRAYQTFSEEELWLRYLNRKIHHNPLALQPNYNLAPTQNSAIVINENGLRSIRLMRWGLVPKWAKDVKSAEKYSLINARSEDVETKRSYKEAFWQRRCLVPVSGFYEWQKIPQMNSQKNTQKNTKQPFAIALADSPIMTLAGIWERWRDPNGSDELDSFAILTAPAMGPMSEIHDRTPVILGPQAEATWLDLNSKDLSQLKGLLSADINQHLQMVAVSKLVNSPRNNRPELLEPIS